MSLSARLRYVSNWSSTSTWYIHLFAAILVNASSIVASREERKLGEVETNRHTQFSIFSLEMQSATKTTTVIEAFMRVFLYKRRLFQQISISRSLLCRLPFSHSHVNIADANVSLSYKIMNYKLKLFK